MKILRGAGLSARARPWPHQPDIAHLVTLDQQLAVPSAVLRAWLGELTALGYSNVRTGALSPQQRRAYDALNFTMAQELTLLHLDLRSDAARTARDRTLRRAVRMRAARADELPALARVDRAAFPSGWGLDAAALSDAAAATPVSRIRVATDSSDNAIGIAVTGRSGSAAFLQRLAVLPEARRNAVATALVADAIAWAHRWRCRTMAVNTQSDNAAALALYHRVGFVDAELRLVVLERPLAGVL